MHTTKIPRLQQKAKKMFSTIVCCAAEVHILHIWCAKKSLISTRDLDFLIFFEISLGHVHLSKVHKTWFLPKQSKQLKAKSLVL